MDGGRGLTLRRQLTIEWCGFCGKPEIRWGLECRLFLIGLISLSLTHSYCPASGIRDLTGWHLYSLSLISISLPRKDMADLYLHF